MKKERLLIIFAIFVLLGISIATALDCPSGQMLGTELPSGETKCLPVCPTAEDNTINAGCAYRAASSAVPYDFGTTHSDGTYYCGVRDAHCGFCNLGYLYCGSIDSRYCINISNDIANCGSCGNACDPGQSCVNDVCTVNCGAGLADCGNSCVNLSSNISNCGRCGDSCSAGKTCINSNCVDLTQTMLQPAVCGNDKCDAGEDTQDCFKDCIDGWTKGVDGWSLAADGVLHGTGNIRALYTDYAFDIDADTDYTLSFYLKGGYCTVSIGLDDNCMTSTWNVEDCGLSQGSTISASTDSNNKDYSYNEKIFSIPSGSKSVNRQYKGVRVKISLSNCGGGGADIQNISLLSSKYVTDEAHYDAMPSSAEVSSCCPNNYCWNGTECVDSALWMKNSSMPPVWNTMLSSSFPNNHVLTSNQPLARGYRCIVLNETRGAEWVPSNVKYDWDYEHSGYCINDTDCFVSSTYVDANGVGCISNNTFIENHYCYNGNWTTRTYIMATQLQAMAENNNFILYCDLPDKTANDYPTGTFSPRNLPKQSSCTMITDNGGNDQITVGVLVDANSEADDVLAHANAVIAGTSNDLNSIFVKTASCTKSGDSQFLKCYGRGSILDDKEPHVYAYYNNVTKYVLFSTERINAIDATFLETIWGTIRDFFRNLFLGKPPAYNYITQTSSFDKIYILKNGALTVTGVEELKYDEADSELRTLLYLNYPSTNQANNPIDLQYISKIGNYSISSNPNYLEIIIKSTDTTGLFRYLTATLRTR